LTETNSAALAAATRPATSMKMLLLFLLMISIWTASHYGAPITAVRQPAD
jgi:hypothetical protein